MSSVYQNDAGEYEPDIEVSAPEPEMTEIPDDLGDTWRECDEQGI